MKYVVMAAARLPFSYVVDSFNHVGDSSFLDASQDLQGLQNCCEMSTVSPSALLWRLANVVLGLCVL
jgi:hypothetical protein